MNRIPNEQVNPAEQPGDASEVLRARKLWAVPIATGTEAVGTEVELDFVHDLAGSESEPSPPTANEENEV